MSKKISFKGTLPMGLEEKLSLSTIKGKIGYRIVKFQVISTAPGAGNYELVGKARNKPDPNIDATIEFSDTSILAAAIYQDGASNVNFADMFIFDNEIFNQDIFITLADAAGNTTPGNYYIELEVMSLSDVEATMLTLKSIKTIKS